MEYEVEVARSDGPRRYRVQMGPRTTVLDALFRIQAEQDDSLTFRCACRVGMCGTCAMSVNRVPRLACKTRLAQLGARVRLAPLPHLPVVRDLVVSLQPFFEQWKRALPALRGDNHGDTLARIAPDPVRERKRDCITCGICYAACGVVGSSREYLGPAAVQRAWLRIQDPRDHAHNERLALLGEERAGVWRCHTQFNCTAVCPKRIDLTDTIVRLKRGFLHA